jgi:hypothetical protein
MDNTEFLTPVQTARLLGICERHLRTLLKHGLPGAARLGARWVIHRETLIHALTRGGPEEGKRAEQATTPH